MCGSARLNGEHLHIHVDEGSNPPERTEGTNGKVETTLKMRRNISQKVTVGPKTQADLAVVKFQNIRKLKSASIACAPTAIILKNM